jgi:hypothetical protein
VKEDARPDPGGGPERDELRETLRSWKTPEAPAELESELRREFRQRRPRRRLGTVWLSLAAVLGLLAVLPIVAARLKERPSVRSVQSASATPPSRAATAATPPTPLPQPRLQPAAPATPSAGGRPIAGRRAATKKPAVPAVVVEAGQAELLAELGRRGWERTEAGPGASLPNMPVAEAPAYRAEWEEVAGEWPAVQVVVSTSGR